MVPYRDSGILVTQNIQLPFKVIAWCLVTIRAKGVKEQIDEVLVAN